MYFKLTFDEPWLGKFESWLGKIEPQLTALSMAQTSELWLSIQLQITFCRITAVVIDSIS